MNNISTSITAKTILTGKIVQATPIIGSVVVSGKKGDPGESYEHPETHSANMIVENSERKFITSNEKAILENIQYNFIHEQMVARDTWNINHNMSKYPSVTVVDSANSVCVGDIEYLTSNSLVIRFVGGFAGKAYLN